MHYLKVALIGLLAIAAAVGIPFAWAEVAGTAQSADPFGGWGGVLSSSPLVAGLIYVFRAIMEANRAREVDAKERDAAQRAQELRLVEIRSERDKEMAAAMADLAKAIDRWCETFSNRPPMAAGR